MKYTYLALFSLILSSTSAYAASALDDYYRVEVIVFKNNDASAGQSEIWPPLPISKLPLEQIATAIDPDKNGSDGFLPLPATQYQLQGVWDALDRSGRYEPLVYAGWLQPALAPGDAKPVQVNIGTAQLLPQSGPAPAPVFGEPTSTTIPAAPPQLVSPLAGAVTIASDYYLYADVNFIYTPNGINAAAPSGFELFTPQITTSSQLNQQTLQALANGTITLEEAMRLRKSNMANTATKKPATVQNNDTMRGTMKQVLVSPADKTLDIAGYRLNQNRRIKLNEIHYFDHPQFGIIIQVSPYEAGETQ